MLESRTPQSELASRTDDKSASLIQRVVDMLLFVGFLLLSAMAIVAVAITTPIVLIISVVAGLFEKNHGRNGWRPAQV